MDFYDEDNINLCYQLWQFIGDARKESSLKNLSIQGLCWCLIATKRNKIYFLIDTTPPYHDFFSFYSHN